MNRDAYRSPSLESMKAPQSGDRVPFYFPLAGCILLSIIPISIAWEISSQTNRFSGNTGSIVSAWTSIPLEALLYSALFVPLFGFVGTYLGRAVAMLLGSWRTTPSQSESSSGQ